MNINTTDTGSAMTKTVSEDKVWDLLAEISDTRGVLLRKMHSGKITTGTYHQLANQLKRASSETIGNRRFEIYARCKAVVVGIQSRALMA